MEIKLQSAGCTEGMERLRTIAGCFCDNMVLEMEEYAKNLGLALQGATNNPKPGQEPQEVQFILKITPPDSTELSVELQEVHRLIRSGKIE